MLIRVPPALRRLVVLMVLAIALTATGFAHRMPSVQDERLALALASGATLADLCGGKAGGSGHPDPHCLACQIVGSADVPATAATPEAVQFAGLTAGIIWIESPVGTRLLDPAHGPQGPPKV